jgi:UDP-N-acetylmuramoyl-tripeptide--D-alanyl-D-alanine ligase
MAIITSIGLSHAINFDDKELGIAKAKGEILKDQPFSFFNENTASYEPFSSYTHRSIIHTDQINQTPLGFAFTLDGVQKGPFILGLQAPHLIQNLHLALACAYKLGLGDEKILKALKHLKTEPQRMTETLINEIEFIDDSYNASPNSMVAAINYLKNKDSKRKVAIIGAMKELGSSSEKEHLALALSLNDKIDLVYCLGEETKKLAEELGSKAILASSLESLQKSLQEVLKPGDSVLIKGSHSTGLHTLLKSLIF